MSEQVEAALRRELAYARRQEAAERSGREADARRHAAEVAALIELREAADRRSAGSYLLGKKHGQEEDRWRLRQILSAWEVQSPVPGVGAWRRRQVRKAMPDLVAALERAREARY